VSLIYPPPLSKHPAKYIIYKEAGVVYALNGETGRIDFSGTDAHTVIQSALNSLTPNRAWLERVVIRGDFLINNSVSPLVIPSYTIIQLDGRITAVDKTKTLVRVDGDNVVLYGGVYDGNRGNEVGGDIPVRVIHLNNVRNVVLQNITVVNGYSRGIEVSDGFHNTLINIHAENCWRNVMFWSSSYYTPRHHVAVNIRSRYARGGSGVDFGTVGGVTVFGVQSEEDDPVSVAIDSSFDIRIYGITSKFRGFALIYASYNETKHIVIEGAEALGAPGATVEVRYDYDISDITFKDVLITDSWGNCLEFKRFAGTGVIRNVKIENLVTLGTAAYKYSVVADSSVQDIYINGKYVDKPMLVEAVKYVIENVEGFRTKNKGTAIITLTQPGPGSVTVAHYLAGTPRIVILTPRGNVGSVWCSYRDSTNLIISISDGQVGDNYIDWYAEL